MNRKCNFCDATTNKILDDFIDIGWRAYSIKNEKAICSCPKHKEDLIQHATKRILKSG